MTSPAWATLFLELYYWLRLTVWPRKLGLHPRRCSLKQAQQGIRTDSLQEPLGTGRGNIHSLAAAIAVKLVVAKKVFILVDFCCC